MHKSCLYIVIAVLLAYFQDDLSAFSFDKGNVGLGVGYEANIDTDVYSLTHSSYYKKWVKSESNPNVIYDNRSIRLEATYDMNKDIDIGLFFKRIKIGKNYNGNIKNYITFGTLGASAQYSYQLERFSIFSDISLGSWIHLDDVKMTDTRMRGFYDIRVGIGYKLSKRFKTQVYLSKDGLYYKWDIDVHTWWHMWNVGLSVTLYPYVNSI